MIINNIMVNANCNTCGGLISGVINNCINSQPIKLCCCNPWYGCSSENKGWICSRCNKSLSPNTKECDCAPNGTYIPYTPYQPYNPYVPMYPPPYIPYAPFNPWDTSPWPLFPIYCTQPITTCYTYSRNP